MPTTTAAPAIPLPRGPFRYRAVVTSRPARPLTVQECPHGALRLAALLEHFADGDSRVIRITHEKFAALAGVTTRTITRWNAAGQAAGLFMVTGGGHRGRTLEYVLASAPAEVLRKVHRRVMAYRRGLRERHSRTSKRWTSVSTHPSFLTEGEAPPPLRGGAGRAQPPPKPRSNNGCGVPGCERGPDHVWHMPDMPSFLHTYVPPTRPNAQVTKGGHDLVAALAGAWDLNR